ncbi:MAG: caspase family protein [Cyanothece sp. SIO1E1]|nr:caspase family protein [Cyanothece sp. SIO1E1]
MKRRAFLKQASLALTAFGVSEAGLSLLANRYQVALAQPTHRRLALLVGINQYPEKVCNYPSPYGSALRGCLTDVELQRELLIYRFGFKPADVLTLTDKQATRRGIETAFFEHLTQQAQPGDVVIFHFSGYGSRVKLMGETETVQNSLVPVDGFLPTEEEPAVNDLLETTLALLLRSLKTTRVTSVLDLSYAEPKDIIQSNLRFRSRPDLPIGQPNPEELEFQARLSRLANTSKEHTPGVILTAAGNNQIAAEMEWNRFSAGLFTHALTQQLWATTPTKTDLRMVVSRTASIVEQLIGKKQQPEIVGQNIKASTLNPYYATPMLPVAADGIVTAVEDDGKTIKLWLGGLPAAVLENYGVNSLLTLSSQFPDNQATSQINSAKTDSDQDASHLSGATTLKIRSQTGLTAKAQLCCSDISAERLPQVGQPVQERVRVLPRNIDLTVALDPSLQRIERVDATSAFANVPRVSSVVAGEPADCLFGKASERVNTTLAASLPTEADNTEGANSKGLSQILSGDMSAPKSSYGLFSLGQVAIPNTLVDGEEAIKTAVNRLAPHLQTLLASKLLRLTSNEGSSRLGVRVTLEMAAPQERPLMQRESLRVDALPKSKILSLLPGKGEIPTLPVDSRIQYRLHNYGDDPLYFILLGFDSGGSAITIYPSLPAAKGNKEGGAQKSKAIPKDIIIPADDILTLPTASEWALRGPGGIAETHLIFSRAPLTQTLNALAEAMPSVSSARRISPLSRPLKVAQALLEDIHQASAAAIDDMNMPSDIYALDVNAWATFSFIYQVV